ncbi:hypothetical protein AX774_g6004 [Zancudomyces culisetae]|uniref:Uncharacterized protein n=1 Tax=Zancudomyces culisetae TaxID=1213189 RepID=A0A1R1PI04_ZANCU|nr:hypothetical protein AX774_g6004 [Zancudomyces culisetae]|eukprot:OMH80559.1 hypothetical protein AX774_g6004 [Zancudomyces culisetae]
MVSETTIVERERGEDFIVLTNNYSTAERTSNEDVANKRNDSKVSLFPNLENNLESLKLSSEDIFQHSFSTNATDNSKLHSIPIFFEYENSLFPNLDVKSSPLNNSITLESLVDAEPESQLDKTNSDYQKRVLVLSNSIYSEKCSSIFSSNEGELSSKILHHNIKLPKREHSSTSLKTSFLPNQISEPLHSRAECYEDSPDSLMPEVYGGDSEMVIDSFPASAQQQPDSSDPSNLDNGVKPLYSKPIPAELKNIDYNNFPDFTNTNNPRSIKKLKIKFHYESETYNIVANMDVNFEKLNSLIYEKISNVYSINPKLTHPPSLSDLIFFDFSANQSNDSNFCSSPFSQPNGSQFERHDGSQFHPKNKLKIKFLDEDASLVIMADDDDLNLAKALSCLNPKSGNLHNQVNDIYRQNSSLRRGKSKLSFADKLELWCMF